MVRLGRTRKADLLAALPLFEGLSKKELGEVAMIAHVPRTATVTSASPVRLLVVAERTFQDLVERMPSIALKGAGVGRRTARRPRAAALSVRPRTGRMRAG